MEASYERSTKEESVLEIAAADFVKTEHKVKKEKTPKLGKRNRKDRAKKFLEMEAEESDTEVIQEISETVAESGKRVCILLL